MLYYNITLIGRIKLLKKAYFKLTAGSLALLLTGAVYAHSHDHGHQMSEKALQASQGVFDNSDVKNRTLADWEGTWQSVYDYLIAGDLDPVIEAKVAKNPGKTFADYQTYYSNGYKTDIQWIAIENNRMDFHKKDSAASCEYSYASYKILTYVSGKKGVRYLFTCQDKNSTAPKYVQFSDHIIEPTKSIHFHIYMGNESHEKLLEEMDNWPTYYPLSLNKDGIVDEMLHH